MTAHASGHIKAHWFCNKKKCHLAPMNRPVLVPPPLSCMHAGRCASNNRCGMYDAATRRCPAVGLRAPRASSPRVPCHIAHADTPGRSCRRQRCHRQPPSHGRDYSTATACSHLLASKCRVQRPMRSVRQRRLKRDNHLADNNLPAASLVSDQTGVSAPWRRGEGRPCRLRLRVTRWNGMDGWMDAPPPLPLGRPSCGATATVPCEGSQFRNRSILTWTAKLV